MPIQHASHECGEAPTSRGGLNPAALDQRGYDALSLLDTRTRSVRETPWHQPLPPFILTLDLHRGTELTPR